MRYVSTRGKAPVLEFDDVLLAGLATDGGLYLPEEWPTFDEEKWRSLRGLSYQELAVEVMLPFVTPSITKEELTTLVDAAYENFEHAAIAPLRQLGPNHFVLELFYGPTLAFKDYALQLVGHLFSHVLKKKNRRVTIVGATSGDTGSAAIEACRDREGIEIFILHPNGRVSDVQRRQMTTVTSKNVHNIAIEGDFDNCQDLVKKLFADADFREEYSLGAVNSINWARIMAQVVYYAWAALNLGAPDRSVGFAVPTGNFGNIFAGWVARQMGLPIERLVIGTNQNDILARFEQSGTMEMTGVEASISPSMDIQVSSNFERLLFELFDRDGARVDAWMKTFRDEGKNDLPKERWNAMRELFASARFDDEETSALIRTHHGLSGQLFCPHSVIGVESARVDSHFGRIPFVSLATAHPAKFPDAVEAASGKYPALPERLSDLMEREERFDALDNDETGLKNYIAKALADASA